MSAFQHFKTLNVKCLWINKRNPLSFVVVTLLPTILVIILSLSSFKSTTSTSKTVVLDTSLCTGNYCPTLYYTPKGLSPENVTLLDNAMNSINGVSNLKLKNVVKVASSNELYQKYDAYSQESIVSASTGQDIFVLFEYNETSGLVHYSFPRMAVGELEMGGRLSAVLLSAVANVAVGAEGSSLEQRFAIKLQPESFRKEMGVVDVLLFWLSVLASCFPLFLLVAYRTNGERLQGATSLMTQWGVSDTVYIFTHIFHYTLFPVISSLLFSIAASILKSNTPPLDFLSFPQIFFVLFLLSFLSMIRGLFAGLLFNSSFAIVLFLLLFLIEFILGDNLESALHIQREITPIFFVFFPFMGVSKLLVTWKANSDKQNKVDPTAVTADTLIGYVLASICVVIFLSLMLKVLRSHWDSSSPFNSLINMLRFASSPKIPATCEEESVLLISQVTKAYGKRQVVVDANLKATTGKVYSLLGKNGAGKSTLMKMMAGMVQPSTGSIKLFGHNLLTNPQLRNKYIGYCAQENQYWHDLTLGQHVHFFSLLVGKTLDIDSELSRVGLETSVNTLATDLSGGQKRRLNLVLCGIRNSKLILLDEPTSGVDHVTQIRIWEYVESLKHEAIVILATHYMEEAHLLSDHLVVMQDGKIACEGTPKGLKEEFGEMYQLRLLVNESAVSDLQQLIKKALPFLAATHVAQGNFKLNFEPRHIQAVTAFLKQAVNLRDFSFQLTNNTVDRVYNLVYKDSAEGDGGDYVNDEEEMSGNIPAHAAFELRRVNTKTALVFNQVRVNYSKNLKLMRRNIKTVAAYFLIFVIFLAIPQLFIQTPKRSKKPLDFTIKSERSMREVATAIDLSDQVKNDADALQKAGINVNQRYEAATLVDELKDMSERINKEIKRSYICGYKLESFSVNRLECTILFDSSRMNQVCVEWIMAAYLKAYQRPNQLFLPVFADPETSFQDSLHSALSFVANMMKFAFSIVVVILAGQFVLYEKKRGMDLALRFQGMLPSAYWTGNLLYHLTLIIVVTGLLTLYALGTRLGMYVSSSPLFIGFVSFGIFLSGMSNLYTTFLRTEANFIGYCVVLLVILNQYLNTDEAPWVYVSPFGLYARMALSTLLGKTSVSHTWVPVILFIIYGLLLVVVTAMIEEARRGSQFMITSLFTRRRKPKSDAEAYALEQLDSSTTQEMRDIRNGKKTLFDHSIVADNVTKRFGEKSVLTSLYFALGQNECFGLLGPNGAGKSTVINMILGILHPTSGKISINDMSGHHTVGYCSQFGFFWPEFTVYEHLVIAATIRGAKSGQQNAWALNVARQVGLASESSLKTRPYDLSGGMRRRLCLGLALMGEPGLLILDEPSAGVDPLNRENIWRIVQNYRQHKQRAQQPASILLTTHHLDEADTLCDRIGIIKSGRLQCIAPQKELKEQYGEGYSLLLMTDCQAVVPANADNSDDMMKHIEQERLATLNRLVVKAMGLSATTSKGAPRNLYSSKSVSRRRITTKREKNGQTIVSWKLYVRLSIPKKSIKFDVMKDVLKQVEHEGVMEWRLGTVELEQVFVSVLL
jgi:ABC-type multidrug transport system ATPase subunit